MPDNEIEHFVRISSKNVSPKDTKPHFLIYYPPKKPFSQENLPLEWQELIIHFSSICLYIYILLLYVPAQIINWKNKTSSFLLYSCYLCRITGGEHFISIFPKNVPPKDTKPHFLIKYPPKKPFSRGFFPPCNA